MTEHDVTIENRRNFSCFFRRRGKASNTTLQLTGRTTGFFCGRGKTVHFSRFLSHDAKKTTGFRTIFYRNKVLKKRIVGLEQRTGIISMRKTVRKPSVSSGRGPMTRRRSSSFKNAARPLVRRQQLLITFPVGPRLSVDAPNDTRSRLSRESSFSFFFVTFFFFRIIFNS